MASPSAVFLMPNSHEPLQPLVYHAPAHFGFQSCTLLNIRHESDATVLQVSQIHISCIDSVVKGL